MSRLDQQFHTELLRGVCRVLSLSTLAQNFHPPYGTLIARVEGTDIEVRLRRPVTTIGTHEGVFYVYDGDDRWGKYPYWSQRGRPSKAQARQAVFAEARELAEWKYDCDTPHIHEL